MFRKRTLTFMMLAVAVTTTAVGLGGGGRSFLTDGRSEARPLDAGWALLAEAEELCRPDARRDVGRSHLSRAGDGSRVARAAGLDRAAVIARRATALEALDIAAELARSDRDQGASISILRRQSQLRAACAVSLASQGATDLSRRSLDGRVSSERVATLSPFLDRLNRAGASAGVGSSAVARSAAVEPPGDDPGVSHETPAAPPIRTVMAEARSVVPTPGRASAPSSIEIAPATSGYRKRVRGWAAVFEREAGALRRGRRDLQLAIDRHSMAEARQACRRFGVVLARLDAGSFESAPSRGLGLRIHRMIEHYWRGVAHCTSGRTAAAFSYLSEGDREWITIAEMASRIFEPTPLRRARGSGKAPAETPAGPRD